MTVTSARAWLEQHRELRHQGYPVVDDQRGVLGVVTRTDLSSATEPDALLGALIKRRAVIISDEHCGPLVIPEPTH